MSAVLITCDWLINGKVVSTETIPVDTQRIAGVEKTVLASLVPGDALTVRLQFDPPLVVSSGAAPPVDMEG